MLYAFVEGLAGVQDKDKLFRRIRICPKWLNAGVENAEVMIDYKSSGAFVKYLYSYAGDKLKISLSGSYNYIQLSLPVPAGYTSGDLLIDGVKRKYIRATINQSHYLIADDQVSGDSEIELTLRKGAAY